MIKLPSQAELRTQLSGEELDGSSPRTEGILGALWLSHQMAVATQEITSVVQAGDAFILVDQDELRGVIARHALPFLERDGQYWGPPPDDATAIREFERLRQAGATSMVVAWPAFWWLDYYAELHRHLRSNFRCVLENERLVVFDLRPA